MKTILVTTTAAIAALAAWAQTAPGETDPVSKKGPVAAIPEPELACAGNRQEFLEYPNVARAAGLEDNVTATYTVTPNGKLMDLKMTSTLHEPEKSRLFEDIVSNYLKQSDYPPGCEKESKQLFFEFFFKGAPASEKHPLIEFKSPNTFRISVNPDVPGGATPNSADRSEPGR